MEPTQTPQAAGPQDLAPSQARRGVRARLASAPLSAWVLGAAATLVLASCAAQLAQERSFPGDQETLDKVTLTSPTTGEVLVWNASQNKYALSPAADHPIETRSVGCVTCHVGQREPHPDDLSYNLEAAIGCTDCHGGVGNVTTFTLAELRPVLESYLKDVIGVADVTSAMLDEKLTRFKRVAGDDTAKATAHVHEPSEATRAVWAKRRGGEELSAGNPEAAYGAQLRESWEYVRFVNPGDLRVASISCGTAGCHGSSGPFKGDDIVLKTQKSMMATAPMLWEAALYNNGAYPDKSARFGESYDPHGQPQSVLAALPEDPIERAEALLGRGRLERLDPLPRFEIGQPSNILRIFERGQKRPLLIGLPTPGNPGGPLEEEPGRPLNRLSQRGLGTLNRTDPVWLNLQRTRLMDPTLAMSGSNDHPGDFRASGCTGCHMVYANDRDPLNELRADCWGTRPEDRKYAKYAHHQGPYKYRLDETGEAQEGETVVRVQGGKDAGDKDGKMRADEPGHPIRHELTVQVPSSQCVVCHMHPGTAVEQSYLGYMWWDLETDGHKLWPKEQIDPSIELESAVLAHNPEGSTAKRVPPLPADMPADERAALFTEAGGDAAKARDLYYRRELLGKTIGSQEFNAELDNMQLGDFKGHGFLFRAVFERDPEGNLQRKEPLLTVGAHTAAVGSAARFVIVAKVVRLEPGQAVVEINGRERTLSLGDARDLELNVGDEATLLCASGSLEIVAQGGAVVRGTVLEREGQTIQVENERGERGSFTIKMWTITNRASPVAKGDELLFVPAREGDEVLALVDSTLSLLPDDPDWSQRWKLAVHLKDIHLERGMHCADCHYGVDSHGDGNLYGELRAATAIKCEDCHGTIDALASLETSGNAGGQDMGALKVRGEGGSRVARFEWQYPQKKDKKTKAWKYKSWDPTKEKTAYRSKEARLIQRSMLYPDLEWVVPQVMHSIDPDQDELAEDGKAATRGRSRYSALARVAKTMRKDGTWGRAPKRRYGGPPIDCERDAMAHEPKQMECYTCHTSWMTSCFGCHLDMKANWKRPALHNEGKYPRREPFLAAGPSSHAPFVTQHAEEYQRNWTSYSFQTLRTDFFMMGKDGDVSGGRFVPVRSACAVTVGSQNQNRENVYSQQQTVSSEGFSGTAFSPHFPHTVRTREARSCTDCHVSEREDNNAQLAQTFMLGSNAANFIGRFCYVAAGSSGFDAVVVTERSEPQAVIGSRLHELAYPRDHADHVSRGRKLSEGYHHGASSVLGVSVPFGSAEVRSIQLRGEYLYTANGTGGVRVYDVAQIDQKGFSERIVSAPVSPIGQDLSVKTQFATAVRAPSTQAVDPTRNVARLDRPQNREQQVHPSYAFLYVTDLREGLILVGAGTLLDGDPDNNFLKRAVTFNPGGALEGARDCVVAGTKVYVCCDAGVVVVDIDDPLHPKIVAKSATGTITKASGIEVQLRYAFVTDAEGVKVLDTSAFMTERAHAEELQLAVVASLPLRDARGIYVSRSYGYVAGGVDGLVVLNLKKPRQPFKVWSYRGESNDLVVNDVKVAATNASMYGYLACDDGLHVLQLTGFVTEADPYASGRAHGKNPKPSANEIASYATRGPALEISEGIDRDRAVDESGHQNGVFGRIGSRPFTWEEMRRLLVFGAGENEGKPFTVPVLSKRPAVMNDAARKRRRDEVLRRFKDGPFRELEVSEEDPAVPFPQRKKKKKKKKKKKR